MANTTGTFGSTSLLNPAGSSAAMTKKYAADAQNYNDLSALQGLKAKGADKAEALKTVARQFEAIMMNEVMKSMRAANEVFAKDSPFNSSATDMYEDMLDQQMTLNMSTGKGSGLADMLVRQLGGRYGLDANGDPKDSASETASSGNWRSLAETARNVPAVQLREAEQQVLDEVDALVVDADRLSPTKAERIAAQATSPAPTVAQPADPVRFETPAEFVETLLPHARKVADELGADPKVLLAQAALETGWGKHMITGTDGAPSYNLFGIKAGSGWTGETAEILTTEYRGGVAMKERAEFRAYDSYADSFQDYLKFLASKPRYAEAVAVANDHVGFSNALQQAGYATDPEYASKIQRIVQSTYLRSASQQTADPGVGDI
ncbi:flagellar assembly peptidoglycan hydrolase FlgJ [Allohahella sp. A8]|uniref:flagellar assembly peptidoglycan hydrolase FlgJ n=1 Tax=Allohahella sp. A8 TaxID=3141461 RepID=UPI003A7FD885